jgi:hypothetical protein
MTITSIILIMLIILMTSVILYSLCLITSSSCRAVHGKSLVFSSMSEARRFEDLLSVGDAESVHRILKALQQRGEIDVIESENEIYVCEPGAASTEHGGNNIFRDLLASAHNPLEALRNLSVMSRFDPGDRLSDEGKRISARGCIPAAIHDLERVTDDLFASEYDISELLENLGIKPGLIFSHQISS